MSPDVRLTSRDRVLFPDDGITKGDLFEYYDAVADTIVPHLKNRPFTLKRYPHGITQEAYFQKQAPKGIPKSIPTRQFTTHPREGGARLVDFVLVNSRDALLWMVQMNCLDMNAWYSRVDKPERPDYVVFDLDPPDDGFANAIRVAHLVREALDELDLRSYVKTSGASGIHVLVPIARRSTFDQTYEFAERVSRAVEERDPGLATTRVAEAQAAGGRRARRPPPERAREDDRVGLLGAPAAGRARLHAAALGGAHRRRASPRLREGGGAAEDRAARRPLRARAPGRPVARAGAPRPQVRAVVIGSGPNGLCGAIALARAGLDVVVHEEQDTLGGGARSFELTLPGFVHDVCSAIHPMAEHSPFIRSLGLELEWVQPDAQVAHPFDDGTALTLERDLGDTAEQLGADGAAYRALVGPLVEHWDAVEPVLLGPLPPSPRALAQLARALGARTAQRAARAALADARALAEATFTTARARAFFAGNAAHSMLPLERRPTGGFGLALLVLGHVYGWGFPRGGAQRLTDALAEHARGLGVELRTGSRVDELPRADVVLADVSPRELLRLARGRLPNRYDPRARALPLRQLRLQARLGARRAGALARGRGRPRRHGPPRRHARRAVGVRVGGVERAPRRAPVRPLRAAHALRRRRARPPASTPPGRTATSRTPRASG